MSGETRLKPTAKDDEIHSLTSVPEIRVYVSDQGDEWEIIIAVRRDYKHGKVKVYESHEHVGKRDGEALKAIDKLLVPGEPWKLYGWDVPKKGREDQVAVIEPFKGGNKKRTFHLSADEWIKWYFGKER